MSAEPPPLAAIPYGRRPLPAALFELLVFVIALAAASLAFTAGWLSVNAAVALTVILLASLIVLSWIHLGQGRHPAFLFLCTLTLFQGGRLLAFCLGAEPDPMRVRLMGVDPFSTGRSTQGLVLLCLVLSAVCIYGVCRWQYRALPTLDTAPAQLYLPYLYLLFAITLPALAWKNYLYFQYVQQEGYLAIYQNYEALAGSAPLIVRALALFALPVFAAIFVFERRRKFTVLVTVLYFASAALILFSGSRLFLFALVPSLWYVSRLRSNRKPRLLILVAVALAMALLAQLIVNLREETESRDTFTETVTNFLVSQGTSLDVTQVAVRYRGVFHPYAENYLLHELGQSFGGSDAAGYVRGNSLASDVSVIINPAGFSFGLGVGGAFLGEAYVAAGLFGALMVSTLVGAGLSAVHRSSSRPLPLVLIVLVLPIVLYMPRGDLLGWLSALIRNIVLLSVIALGWRFYAFVCLVGTKPAVPPHTLLRASPANES